MIKFAFVIDTSPLMQIKKPVYGSFNQSEAQAGMSFFEQSVYAIEEFVTMRKKLNLFR
jgi:hypothetical protein